MALINCAECHREISDKAAFCPHCGNPLLNDINQQGANSSDALITKSVGSPRESSIAVGVPTDTVRPYKNPRYRPSRAFASIILTFLTFVVLVALVPTTGVFGAIAALILPIVVAVKTFKALSPEKQSEITEHGSTGGYKVTSMQKFNRKMQTLLHGGGESKNGEVGAAKGTTNRGTPFAIFLFTLLAIFIFVPLFSGGPHEQQAASPAPKSETAEFPANKSNAPLNAKPEVKNGLPESKRKELFMALVAAEDRADANAQRMYPIGSQGNTGEQVMKRAEVRNTLMDKYKSELTKRNGVTLEQFKAISIEGVTKNWPMKLGENRPAQVIAPSLSAAPKSESRPPEVCKENETSAFMAAKMSIEKRLVAPSTAKFGFLRSDGVKVVYLGGCMHRVFGYVDAQNSYGGMIRNKYIVKVTFKDATPDSWDDFATEVEFMGP